MIHSTHQQQVYPKRYWAASPTFEHWNKITAADIHTLLRTLPGFEGQNVYFYSNHPIQYVRIVGMVVEIEAKAGGKYVLLTLDDGSGKCLIVKINVRRQQEGVAFPSNTTLDEVNVRLSLGPETVIIHNNRIDIGTILKAKGTLDRYRDELQMNLKRVSIVSDTNEEVACWAETARWKRDVLSIPWLLNDEQREAVDEGIRKAQKRERAKEGKKKKSREEWVKREEKMRVKEGRKEGKREEERRQKEKMYDEGALGGSGVVRAPWE